MMGFFLILILFQVNSVDGLEELPIISIDFISGNDIDFIIPIQAGRL